ncbi:phosphonate ABC transporter, permease protein PhnE [Verticiella sediminum]|uniref:Phosphonate ABC transporter, permease protein PhnE n=1 Tax=Verticiella sediminum TaxID=1247510 RepID=A0A556AS48_9BURK|nr:phosphonate ABC transporter, permease protein PhnE [Verticiella sediminum]TSH95758.1 phosphonate ABC transporter, permease protein PhnE [Verticiella sediminum]
MSGRPVEPAPIWQRRTAAAQRWSWLCWAGAALIFAASWKLVSDNTIWAFAADAPAAGWDMVSRMWPPRWSYLGQLLRPLWDTLNIATLGTALGTLIAVPLAFLAARNTTPSRWLMRPLALTIIVASRSINSLIWALLLVTVVGPGVLAGIIAIALRSIGFIGKLLYESIEEIDVGQVQAISATGASRCQVLSYAVMPQIMPTLVGTTVYRWDINIRESTVLGIVGAGGIGLPLAASVDTLAWPQVTVIFAAILLTVFAAEWVSLRVRQALI